MPSQIRPNRLEVSDRFPMLGFTIKTDGESKRYEVAIAADAALFGAEGKAKRTRANFYSSRAAGLQPVEHGEAVYVLPPEVLARFVGQEKLYYALATYPNGKTANPEIATFPSEGSAYINLKALSGRSLRRIRVLPSRQRAAATYGNGGGSELDWAGDAATPGTQPVSAAPSAAPAASPPQSSAKTAALEYDDGFGYLPSPKTQTPPARAQSGQSVTLNWDDVQSIAQPTDVSCWATSGAMVVGWRDQMSLTPETIARIAGSTTATGLDPAQVGQFAQDLGLLAEAPQSYTVDSFRQMLEQYGPLWVAAVVPGLHAIVVTGIYSDGAADGSDTYLRITDPWDRVAGTPGAPGAYLDTHNTGSRYILTWADFVREYEGAARIDTVNLQILHPAGATSRRPNRAGAAGYAMAAVRAQDATSWSVNWDEVEMFPQPTQNACWATAAAMVVGWRDRVCLSAEMIGQISGRTTVNPLLANEFRRFATEVGLEYRPPASYLPDAFREILENYGPLWVAVQLPGSGHAIVVTGMYSDGAPETTYVRITDPWDRDAGTPGAPGNYRHTGPNELPATGSRYILTWADFSREYEGMATTTPDGTVNVQILHSAGTGGRTPSRSGAAGYAMAGAVPRALDAEDDAHGIDGPIPSEPQTASAQAYPRALATSEYPQASRFEPAAASNYRASTAARTINRVVIHITDGGANINGTISWFQNPSARVSAHYVVGQDGEVVQMVRNNDVAWHARSANSDSIGIEHVANTRGLAPTDAEYCASAALTRWLCDTYGIDLDRTHVLGHAEADPGSSHTGCPNAVWDWDYYMGLVQSGSCYPRPQAQAASLSNGAGVVLPPPPPPVVRSRAMNAEVAATIAGAVIERVISHDGSITWELEQLRGLKHPNDTAPSPVPPFRDAPTIRLDTWPLVEALDTDVISAWFKVDWQFNGRSLGNVRIANIGTNGALLQGLHVTARIMDDNIVYPAVNPTYAALRIGFNYRFTRAIGSDWIAVTDLHLFGDGTYESTSRWEQS